MHTLRKRNKKKRGWVYLRDDESGFSNLQFVIEYTFKNFVFLDMLKNVKIFSIKNMRKSLVNSIFFFRFVHNIQWLKNSTNKLLFASFI